MKLNKFLVAAVAVGTLWSCQKEDVSEEFTNPDETSGKMVVRNFRGNDLLMEDLGDLGYRLSDYIIPKDATAEKGAKVRTVEDPPMITTAGQKLAHAQVKLWPNNTVIYVISSNVSERIRKVIFSSMEEWSTKTNVRFKERTNENYYVTFGNSGSSGNSGYANLGVNGNRGIIKVGSRVDNNVMIHEIGHCLGFIHEQNRSDRDKDITVHWDKISSRNQDQYYVDKTSTPLTDNVDYNSTMMYNSSTFANSRSATMTRNDTGERIKGFGFHLTAQDIEGTNKAYPSKTNPTNPTTPTTPPTTDICSGVEKWVRQSYKIGSKVTYQGFLFERTFSGWVNQGKCGTPVKEDICAGVAAYSANKQYKNGDKVTYKGDLYLAKNNRWTLQGKCGQ